MKYFKALCLLTLFLAQSAFALVHLSIEPDEPSVDDELRLVFTYKGHDTKVLPDFSLLDHDFRIVSTGKSTSVSIINGDMTSTTKWIVNLQPKRAGQFLIPSLAFGKDKNPTRTITIRESRRKTPSKVGATIFMEAKLDKKESYVQAQLTYTIKLYYAKQLASGNFSAPKINNALMLQLGDSKQYRTVIKGVTYQVAEQRYAVFPEKSGTLSISAPLFQGIMQRDNFSDINQLLMNVHKPVRITAPDVTAKILPIPSTYPVDATWLPTSNLTLTEESQGFKNPKIGQPITRIIKMRAKGLTADQLPTLSFENVKGANVYPQKPISKNHKSRNTVIGEKSIRVVYIPDNSTEVTIPKLSLPWWNVDKNKLMYATLKPKQFKVTGAPISNQLKPQPLLSSQPVNKKKSALTSPKVFTNSLNSNTLLPWFIAALLAGSWLLYFLRRLFKTKSNPAKPVIRKPVKSGPTKISRSLKKACVANDINTAKSLLLSWAKSKWPDTTIHALSDIKYVIHDASFITALDELEKSLYANEASWHGHSLWVAWLKLDMSFKKKKETKESYHLPVLNPTSD